jgi:hypothetical protein
MPPRRGGTCLASPASENRNGATFTVALGTGMRGGEILASQKPGIDLARGTLQVRRTLILNGSSVGTPKSKDIRRPVQLPRVALGCPSEAHEEKWRGYLGIS